MKSITIRKRLWQILEKGNEDDKASVYTDIFLITLIILNIIAVILETVDSIYANYKYHFLIFFFQISSILLIFHVFFSFLLSKIPFECFSVGATLVVALAKQVQK